MQDKGGGQEMTTAMVPAAPRGLQRNKSAQAQQIRQAQTHRGDYVPHLNLDQVHAIAEAANNGRNGERNKLMVQTIFDGCFRVSEALRIQPAHVAQNAHGWRVELLGKGGKRGVAAISPSLAAQLQAFAYRHKVKPTAEVFPISRTRAFRIVDAAMARAGIRKPDGVGTVHVLRHSGAIERLRVTGNPRAVQEQLRHADARMTLRYMKTLTAEESVQIQQGVDFGW